MQFGRSENTREKRRPANPQAAVPPPGPRDRPRFQDRPSVPVNRHSCVAGGLGSISGGTLRGYKPLHYPRQACNLMCKDIQLARHIRGERSREVLRCRTHRSRAQQSSAELSRVQQRSAELSSAFSNARTLRHFLIIVNGLCKKNCESFEHYLSTLDSMQEEESSHLGTRGRPWKAARLLSLGIVKHL